MGAHSVVRSVTELSTGKQWACKCLKVHHEASSARSSGQAQTRSLDAVFREIDVLNRVQHQGVVQMREYFIEGNQIYIILERVTGRELLDAVMASESGHLSEQEARHIFVQILEAVHYLHSRDVVHRDLKLENIVQNKKGGKEEVKIVDFGLAAVAKGSSLKGACGTPYYAAPEVVSDVDYGPACDMWSVGVVLYAMLSGSVPFFCSCAEEVGKLICSGEVNLTGEVWDSVSEDAKNLVSRMLVVNPGHRITAAEALDHTWTRGKELVDAAVPV